MEKFYYYEYKNCNTLQVVHEKKGLIAANTPFACNLLLYNIVIAETDGCICRLFFSREKLKNHAKKETRLIKHTIKQLDEYFSKKRKTFDIPVKLNGTEFQLKVWKALQDIPYGETRSYGDIAAAAGNPKAARAVGMANNKNPVAVIIPCHRVIGANGSLTGYAGGLEIKEFLLNLEKTP